MFIEGQKVICINGDFPAGIRRTYRELPEVDTIYTVRTVFSGREKLAVIRHGHIGPNAGYEAASGIGLLLEELSNPPDPKHPERELGFTADRFAPLGVIKAEKVIEGWGTLPAPA